MGSYSDIFFARPSFAEGMARIMDFGNTLPEYNRSPDPDAGAIAVDWNAVAEDLYAAIEQVTQETPPAYERWEYVTDRSGTQKTPSFDR